MATPTTVRLNAAAALLKLESTLRDLPAARRTEQDRRAIRHLVEARMDLTFHTDPPV